MKQPEAARERSRALVRTSPLTGHGVAPLRSNSAVPPAPPADRVLRHYEATGGHAETVGDGPEAVTGSGIFPAQGPQSARSSRPGAPCRPAAPDCTRP
ncbi:MAG: hypothetical protein LBD24_08330 [Spirochaetaceae bacterium]|nr:hypothetical protein [Spirochaetaceae bacterium]